MNSAPPQPLAFIYDRHATDNTVILEQRLEACVRYAAAQGWNLGGRWVDKGDYALTDDHRPEFDALLRAMRAASSAQPRVCLVHDWHRLSRGLVARGLMTRRVLVLSRDVWVETCGGEMRSADGQYRQRGRLTAGPVTA